MVANRNTQITLLDEGQIPVRQGREAQRHLFSVDDVGAPLHVIFSGRLDSSNACHHSRLFKGHREVAACKGGAMSQMIACRSQRGIVLGADAHSVEVDHQGNLQALEIERLFQLNSIAVLMVGGGSAGSAMGTSLKSFMGQDRFDTIEDVYAAALPFLATEYETYMQHHCDQLPIDPIHQIYNILAGHSPGNTQNPFQMYLIWTKRHLPLLDGDAILSAYAVPRLIQLEVQLNRMSRENRDLEAIQTVIKTQIQRSAQMENREVNASYALITASDIRIENDA